MHRLVARLAVVVAAAVLAIALTWPLAARFGQAGRIDSGDGRYSVWNVAWIAHALTTDPRILFDANIFSPHEDALAFSEANLVAGVLAVPAWVVTHNPVATMNWVILCAFTLSFLCTYALVQHLTGNTPAAARAAIAYAFCPFAFAHIPHVQLLMTFGPPLALWRLHKFVDGPSWRTALGLGLAVALQALACGYYGLYGGLVVALGIVWLGGWSGQARSPRYWLLTAVAALVAGAIVLPFFLPYLGIIEGGFQRSLDDARLFRAGWRAYFASAQIFHRWMLPLLGTWREVLFPGFLAIIFSVIAAVAALRIRARGALPTPRFVVGFYLLVAGLAMWASFGPDAGLYAWLYHGVPMFSMLRAPARFGLFVTFGLQVAASIGFAWVLRTYPGRRAALLTTAVMVYTLVKSSVGGLALAPAPPVHRVYRQLAILPRGGVAEFPFFSARDDWHRHTSYMLMSAYHWQPLLNGYSDYLPPGSYEDMKILSGFPSDEAWIVLERRGARYVVAHWSEMTPADQMRIRAALADLMPRVTSIVDTPEASLFRILQFPERAGAAAAPAALTGF